MAVCHGPVLGWPVASLSCCVAHSFPGLLSKTSDMGACLLGPRCLPAQMSPAFFPFSTGPDLSLCKRWFKFSSSYAAGCKLCRRISPSIHSSVLVFQGQLVRNRDTNPVWFLFSFFVCLKAILTFLTAGDSSFSLNLIQSTAPTSQILVISKRCLFPQKNSNEVTVWSQSATLGEVQISNHPLEFVLHEDEAAKNSFHELDGSIAFCVYLTGKC